VRVDHTFATGPDGSTRIELHFAVSDTGIGIPADKLQAIFAPFVQGDNSITRKYGGTGLGLAISSRLVELLGGRLWANSALGQGSTFHFTAMVRAPRWSSPGVVARPGQDHRQAERSPSGTNGRSAGERSATATSSVFSGRPPSPTGSLRVLLAEDNPVNQQVASAMLQRLGHAVTVVENGLEALAALERSTFDLVLMDLQMPEMDGLKLTALIRQQEQEALAQHLPIIALTAHAMKGDRERCLEAGMDGYVSKPIHESELSAAIAAALALERPAANGPTSPEGSERSTGDLMTPRSPEGDSQEEVVLDRAALLHRLGGDLELLGEILEVFRGTRARLMAEIGEAIEQGDSVRLARSVHNLKGTLSNLSARAACEASQRLEALARTGSGESYRGAFCSLEAQMERLGRALDALGAELSVGYKNAGLAPDAADVQ
jgi:CheY-like chemotaxis protein/HPt (histidine-containing phosphotransfer) domain-containing protein